MSTCNPVEKPKPSKVEWSINPFTFSLNGTVAQLEEIIHQLPSDMHPGLLCRRDQLAELGSLTEHFDVIQAHASEDASNIDLEWLDAGALLLCDLVIALNISLPTCNLISDRPFKESLRDAEKLYHQQTPVKGLLLAGGKSSRMGRDKALLELDGKRQIDRMHNLMKPFCTEVLVSCRPGQQEMYSDFEQVHDVFCDMGPLSGILSAFRLDPTAAWLVVACDLPFLELATLETLFAGRKVTRLGTAFRSSTCAFPEPLCTIFEPKAYGRMLDFVQRGYTCPRKVLINSPISLLEQTNPHWLDNMNRPDDYADAARKLS